MTTGCTHVQYSFFPGPSAVNTEEDIHGNKNLTPVPIVEVIF